MSKLEIVNSLKNSTAAPAMQVATLQQQLPQLARSIEELSRSVPQPLTPKQISQTIRPLLIEQFNEIQKREQQRHRELLRHLGQQNEESSELKLMLYVAISSGALILLILIYLLTRH